MCTMFERSKSTFEPSVILPMTSSRSAGATAATRRPSTATLTTFPFSLISQPISLFSLLSF